MSWKRLFIVAIFFISNQLMFSQNGLKGGKYFLLKDGNEKVSVNEFDDNKIVKSKDFTISENSIYTTDHKTKVAILDTTKNIVTLFDIQKSIELSLKIPYKIKPKAILLWNGNLIIGGEMGKEILVQYQIDNKEWHQLHIPGEVKIFGKAIDDLVVNDSLLIAIDNIIMPKYALFYNLNPKGRLEFSHFKELKTNGAYESIRQGRIAEQYFGLLSKTFSGYVGESGHITIYNNLELTTSFALSTNQQKKGYHTFTDFIIVKNNVLIASKEKGLGILEIKSSYFKDDVEHRFTKFNSRVDISRIKYERFKNETLVDLTIIPNTEEYVILTLEDKKGSRKHQIQNL